MQLYKQQSGINSDTCLSEPSLICVLDLSNSSLSVLPDHPSQHPDPVIGAPLSVPWTILMQTGTGHECRFGNGLNSLAFSNTSQYPLAAENIRPDFSMGLQGLQLRAPSGGHRKMICNFGELISSECLDFITG